ncbi:GTP binding protein (EngB) [Purpureocillium lavendulum]|uniref:GTP binding protein (EngB) n=1 Tax=Purpureocillium lavendulum TaxID=1247861 RepID=A0AB34FIL1_9HYPO|nr:GTP binding protein (EngB) [Purpureocillium lavendulum]
MSLPLRQLTIRQLPAAPAALHRQALSFSGSASRAVRQRPGSFRRTLRAPVAQAEPDSRQNEVPSAAAAAATLKGNPPAPATKQPTGKARRAHAHGSGDAQPPKAGQQSVSPEARKAALERAISQIPTDARSLAAHKLIRHSPVASPPLTVKPSRAEAHQLAAAERFFERHPCRLMYSAASASPRQHAPNAHVPEVAILGASNVGKSSFLNALVGRPRAAHVSQRPGRTTLMNVFGVGPRPAIPAQLVRKGTAPPRHSLILVDTPGYGYRSQSTWGDAVTTYLRERRMLRGAVLLLSSEKGRLLPEDQWLLKTLAEGNTRTVVVLTKADKGRGDWPARCAAMAELLLRELRDLNETVGGGWRTGAGATGDVFITAAGMDTTSKLGNGGGMGGVRAAILEMAGFTLQDKVAKKDENVTYTGPIVSFDDIPWQ